MQRVALLTIGSELLSGRVINTNQADVGALLKKKGLQLVEAISVADHAPDIQNAVEAASARSDALIISGGLGPTRDDITKHVLAKLSGVGLRRDPEIEKHLRRWYAQRGREAHPLTLAQADVPEGWEPLPNAMGSAPGLLRAKGECWWFALPGVPHELRHMVEQQVIPRLLKRSSGIVFGQRVIRLYGIPESNIAERTAQLEAELPSSLSLAYLPRRDGVWIELNGHTEPVHQNQFRAELDKYFAVLRDLFPHEIYAQEETTLSALLGNELKYQNASIATAESLTAGAVSSLIAETSGSSAYLVGGVVSYATRIKVEVLGVPAAVIEREGVASEAVACAMAEGVRTHLGSDVGLATTGWAEREPGSDEAPYAWIGFADERGSRAIRLGLLYDRNTNRERTANAALIFALRQLIARRRKFTTTRSVS